MSKENEASEQGVGCLPPGTITSCESRTPSSYDPLDTPVFAVMKHIRDLLVNIQSDVEVMKQRGDRK